MPDPTTFITLHKILESLRALWRETSKLLKRLDEIKVSLALVVVLIVIAGVLSAGTLAYRRSHEPPPAPPPEPQLARIENEAVDLGSFCGAPASANLTSLQCEWVIRGEIFDDVCMFQYPNRGPLHMEFDSDNSPNSGTCKDQNGQVVLPGGVHLGNYCNHRLANRPADARYEAVPVEEESGAPSTDRADRNAWKCKRRLDVNAVCISTYQDSRLVGRVESRKVVCYRPV